MDNVTKFKLPPRPRPYLGNPILQTPCDLCGADRYAEPVWDTELGCVVAMTLLDHPCIKKVDSLKK